MQSNVLYGSFAVTIFISSWALTLSVQPKYAIARALESGIDNRTIPRSFCRNLTDFCLEKVSIDMKVDEWTSEDVYTLVGGEFSLCAGLTSNALPEAQGIFTLRVHKLGCPPEIPIY